MKIHTKIEVAASAEKVWSVIAEKFGDVAAFTSSLESSSLIGNIGVGAIRTCNAKAIGPFPAMTVQERLVEFDANLRRFTYVAHSGLPGIFLSVQNTWSIDVINEKKCVIHSEVLGKLKFWLRPLSWVLPIVLKKEIDTMFEELAYFIERDEVHPRKSESLLEPANG